MNIGLFLLALGFGYKIYAEASAAAKKKMRALGRAVGVFMMIVSLVGTLCGIWCAVSALSGSGYCPLWGKAGKIGWYCPFTKKMIPPAQK